MLSQESCIKLGIILMLSFLLAGEGVCFQYSRQVKGESGYSAVQLVAVSELFKMFVSAALLLSDSTSPPPSSSSSSSPAAAAKAEKEADDDGNEEGKDEETSVPSSTSAATAAFVAAATIISPAAAAIATAAAAAAITTDKNCERNCVPWYKRLVTLLLSGRQMLVLVALYLASNLCSLYATATVGAAVSTLFSQLKILTTALCGQLILGKSYSRRKWACLCLLVVGCCCVSYPVVGGMSRHGHTTAESPPNRAGENQSAAGFVSVQEKVAGMLCLAAQVTISGFASVYFELVLKGRQEQPQKQSSEPKALSIWERNFQLAAFTVLCTAVLGTGRLLLASVESGPPVGVGGGGGAGALLEWMRGLAQGWTALAWVTALCQGGAGLFVAATLKYADAVLKCFATSLSIIVVTIINVVLFGGSADALVQTGICLSVGAMLTYSYEDVGAGSGTAVQAVKRRRR